MINLHRKVIYTERHKILDGIDLKTNIQSMVRDEIVSLIDSHQGDEQYDAEGLIREVSRMMPVPPELDSRRILDMTLEEMENTLTEHAEMLYGEKEEKLSSENMRMLEHLVMLRTLDTLWMEHLTMVEQMRRGIGWRAIGQTDPLVAYKREGHALFESLLANIRYDVSHTIYHADITKKETPPSTPAPAQTEATTVGKRVGRNAPCPCGSRKKYKHCCGK